MNRKPDATIPQPTVLFDHLGSDVLVVVSRDTFNAMMKALRWSDMKDMKVPFAEVWRD